MNETINQLIKANSFNINIISAFQGIGGIAVLMFIAWLLSSNRKAIQWSLIIKALAIQIIIAICVLYIPFVQSFFDFIGNMFSAVLNWTKAGSIFLFGDLASREKFGNIFAFQILPAIVFFSALMSLFFYLGILQRIVKLFATLMRKAVKLSGSESLVAVSNIFLGQLEAPLLVKPYLSKMTRSEIMLVMTAGMSTMSAAIIAVYIHMLGNGFAQLETVFARHIIAASVMAAPGAIAISKMLVPQTEKVNEKIDVAEHKPGSNVLEAISNGTVDGLKLAANVAAMLLVFYALIAGVNHILNFAGKSQLWLAASVCTLCGALLMAYKILQKKTIKLTYTAIAFFTLAVACLACVPFYGINTTINTVVSELTTNRYNALSMEFVLGYIFSPVIRLTGVCSADVPWVGQLLGQKIILTEFFGYSHLAEMVKNGIFAQNKSAIIATYILCGFANFASIGMLIGGIGSLAPSQKTVLASLGIKAMIGGTITALISAAIISIMI